MKRPDLRQRAWAAMRSAGVFTVFEIAKKAGCDPDPIRRWFDRLVKRQYLRYAGKRKSDLLRESYLFQLHCNSGPIAPYWNKFGQFVDPNLGGEIVDPRQRLWTAICTLKTFMVDDLLAQGCNENNLSLELNLLIEAGYLLIQKQPTGRGGQPKNLYQLIMCHGPIAPILDHKKRWVYDPNLDRYLELAPKLSRKKRSAKTQNASEN